MNLRLVALTCAVVGVGVFSACPAEPGESDAGTDGGTTQLSGTCTGGCGPNQVCDVNTRTCIDACGGCDNGVCTRNADGQLQCVPQVTTCNGTTCQAGQNACVSGACSCLGFTRASVDTCAAEGMVCNQPYNAVAQSGGSCEAPKAYQACKTTNCPSGNCAGCPTGHLCSDLFDGLDPVCLKQCQGDTGCDVGEVCTAFTQTTSLCLPSSLLTGRGCAQPAPDGGTLPDGGLLTVRVPVSNTCLLPVGNALYAETVPSGNCSYAFMRFSNMELEFSTCRPPGTATEGQACRREYTRGTEALQCATGLECMPIDGVEGVCMRMCNAAAPTLGFEPTPGCNNDEACVNLYRKDDPNAVLGVCTKTCSVFSPTANTCADIGSRAATCLPTPSDGVLIHTSNGAGICVPQKTGAAALGQQCVESDPIRGSACAAGLMCNATAAGLICEQPCDLACSSSTPPSRCATQANATCPAGKSCTRVSSSSSAVLGFCR